VGCGEPTPRAAPADALPGGELQAADLLVDRAAESGLDFVHFNGMSGEYYMAEITGAGVAVVDYDQDGRLDVFVLQGQMLGPGKTIADALLPPAAPPPFAARLFRNELEVRADGSRRLRFTDVTEQAGIRAEGYAMGVATGDYTNNGFPDIYVTNFRSNQLWRNNGDGTFTDVTAASGSDDPRWSVPATFFDYDRDGWLDLFVGNYNTAGFTDRVTCRDFLGAQDYCGPGAYEALPDTLFRNRGDGTFEDVTRAAGLHGGFGPALGAVALDFTGDGWPDLYVANDASSNNLWVNQGDGTFRDEALLAGVAVNGDGKAQASMGVDAGDFDADGDFDLFMTHLTGESNTLYQNLGGGTFQDATATFGLGAPSVPYTSFGTAFFDLDNDGWLDLFIANGAVKRLEALARQRDPFPLHQSNQLFLNRGDGRYEEITRRAGAVFALSEVSRGAAFGDIDNDGDTDIVLTNNNGPVRLLINQVGQDRPWIGVRAVLGHPGRDAIGARVGLFRAGRTPLWRRVATDGSYASANDPRVLFGLGDEPGFDRLEIHWGDGTVEEWRALEIGRYHTLRRGEGTSVGVGAR
jgi:hypothetical protein